MMTEFIFGRTIHLSLYNQMAESVKTECFYLLLGLIKTNMSARETQRGYNTIISRKKQQFYICSRASCAALLNIDLFHKVLHKNLVYHKTNKKIKYIYIYIQDHNFQ